MENNLLETFLVGTNIAITMIILIYSSWSDYKTREVSNRVWTIYAPIALFVSSINLVLFTPSQIMYYVLSIGITIGLALLLFYLGLFEGADSKALMCIALALPFAPLTTITPYFSNLNSPISQYVFPLTIFSNGVLFAATSSLYMIVINVVWHKKTKTKFFSGTLASAGLGSKLVVLFTGHKMNICKVEEKWHIYPLEDIDESNRKLVAVPDSEERDKIVERLSNAVKNGKIDAYVWATPGLPMLIFVMLGFIAALTLGDLIWLFIKFILGG